MISQDALYEVTRHGDITIIHRASSIVNASNY